MRVKEVSVKVCNVSTRDACHVGNGTAITTRGVERKPTPSRADAGNAGDLSLVHVGCGVRRGSPIGIVRSEVVSDGLKGAEYLCCATGPVVVNPGVRERITDILTGDFKRPRAVTVHSRSLTGRAVLLKRHTNFHLCRNALK